MAKSDISEAFRLIPISPKDYHLTGFFFQGYYYDRCLPMGCASSCKIFERFSTALKWILENKFGVHNVVKILDDFMFIESDYNKCAKSLQAFIKLCSDVGVPLAVHKTEGPTNVITFLGIQLNSIQMIAQLPPDKIAQYTEDVKQALLMSKITLRELKSLTGKLQFATTVVTTGKAFLRRMYDLTKGITKPFYFVRLTKGVKHAGFTNVVTVFIKSYPSSLLFLTGVSCFLDFILPASCFSPVFFLSPVFLLFF